ncbi:putative serine protease EDA2 [Grifola frondosa]|uniref:Putative serine protease EDA2 n=1 Tax=Grifola frondosa TaxID=5627 RepID=A0A1C7M549_GRIFR|nr:putative serine protease EDA2 [Grifola frondosa]
MLRSTLTGIVAFAVLLSHVQARLSTTSAQGINLQRLGNAKQEKLLTDVVNAATFPVYNFTQPLDHFTDTGFTWNQRYWVSTRHYKQGGPVVVFEAGEGPGDVRIPILDTGIVNILTNATGGLGIILEHRYYGESVPVQNFTTDSLRWLNNEQAAADSAYFMSHVKFEGIPHDLTAPGTPWIYYGGSYGGARAAHMRVLYPNVTFGAIASSGVTHATLDDWRYYDIIRQYAPSDCMAQVVKSIVEFDDLIANPSTHHAVKALFGLPNVTHDADVASILSAPLGAWQDTNWDPAVSTTDFATFCNALGTPDSKTISTSQGITVSSALANYATYINETFASDCPAPATQDECFGTYDASAYQATDLSQTWRLWTFQVCTQWGFFSTPPPDPSRPRIISRLITEEYSSMICRLAYPPGKFFQVPPQPNITAVNALGGYNIAADRLAIIDGQADPWRGDTPHSPEAKNRTDTIIRPFKLIPGAVHHWDENGLADPSAEPPAIHTIHQQEIEFVKAWLQDFKSPKDTA